MGSGVYFEMNGDDACYYDHGVATSGDTAR